MELLGRRTLLFTDIEGSTALLQRVGHPQFVELMDRHHDIMRTAIRNNSGEEIRNEGDGFVVFFPDPINGLNCAIECQQRLKAGPWPPEAAISVRMGLHEGEIGFSESGHHGLALHEAARVSSAAHGGQVLLSEAARDAVGTLLPDDSQIDLIELGTFPLKDLGPHVPLIQISHPDLDHDFPLPQNTGGGQHNLPSQLTSLVGREGDADDVDELMRSHRLVTLLGSGGVGKTRLALQVGANVDVEFRDGVWLVELAPIEDPDQIVDEICRAMRIPDDGRGTQTLTDSINNDDVLIILDNCEHLLDGVAQTVDVLLRECPGVRILATSREPLGTQGEVRWRVPSLPVSAAVELMIERAELVAPSLVVDEAERAILSRVCRRLDGIPLAIELVAGRLGTIPIEEIESRLLDRLRLLSTGARGHVPRHQTLHAALDWSYQLLSADEKTLLRRLAIFPGPHELKAAETVCSDEVIDELDVLDLLESLHMKSLITMDLSRKPPLATRSEIVSQFAEELLDETGERSGLAAKHADFYFDVSKGALVGLRRIDRTDWLSRIDADRENLSAAYDWLAEHDPDRAASMLMNLKEWLITSMSTPWLSRVRQLSERDDVPPRTIAGANALRSMLSGYFDFESTQVAAECSQRAQAHLEAVADPAERVRVMTNLAGGCRESQPDFASELAQRALTEAEELGDEASLMAAMLDLLTVHHEHHEMSKRLRSSALALMEEKEEWASVHPLVDGALAMHQTGEHDQAIEWLTLAENMLPRVPQAAGLMTEDAKVWMIWSVLIRAEIGDTETAILLAEDGLRAFGDGHVLYTKTLTSNYGQALMVAGRVDEARLAFLSTLELADAERYVSFAIASLGLARLDLEAGDFDAAHTRLSDLATLNRREWVRARAHDLLAVLCARTDQWEEAAEHVSAADLLRRPTGFAAPPALATEAEAVRAELGQRTL